MHASPSHTTSIKATPLHHSHTLPVTATPHQSKVNLASLNLTLLHLSHTSYTMLVKAIPYQLKPYSIKLHPFSTNPKLHHTIYAMPHSALATHCQTTKGLSHQHFSSLLTPRITIKAQTSRGQA
ncbi:hypothetical protein E2C01_037995 [Portunus trituberculatus]|uniref:Uncharacterized protein n=1 Tax=Portunus trituberculatus TaxID=210409 RepID=A0A5B7FCZ7_PORTR|nr:hypothetical protein [Portunus trituberculatus]